MAKMENYDETGIYTKLHSFQNLLNNSGIVLIFKLMYSGSEGFRCIIRKHFAGSLKNDGAFNGFSYRFEFTSKDGEWLTIDAPFSSFVPKFMGETTSAPPVDRARIKTFGFLIADKQNGPFRLEIDWIGAYRR